MTCIILPLHKYCYRKKIKREVWFSSLRKKVPKSSTKKPFTFFYLKLVEVPGVVRGILKTLWQKIGEYEIFLAYVTHRLSQKFSQVLSNRLARYS